MHTDSKLTALFGIKYPIVQGPFGGGLSTVRLTSTVSNLGGLGAFGAHNLEPEAMRELAIDLRSQTERSFAINLWVSDWDPKMDEVDRSGFSVAAQNHEEIYRKFGAEIPKFKVNAKSDYERQVEEILRVKPKVFSFVFGIPSQEILRECRRLGIVTLGAATTINEAVALEAAEVDVVLATGVEAGGHRPWFLEDSDKDLVGTFPLIPMVKDRIKIPIIAAGGIVDQRGARAAMALGADAVQVGTSFLATEESGASNIHKQRLHDNTDGRTRLSKAFTGRWARFMPNVFLDRVDSHPEKVLPFPAQSWIAGPIRRGSVANENGDYQSLYASQAVPLVKHRTATEVFEELKNGVTGTP